MTAYTAPLDDMRFLLGEAGLMRQLNQLPGAADWTPDLIDAILGEAAKLARDELGPLNQTGDRVGAVLEDGAVRTPPGFREAYRHYVDGGWNALPFPADIGGQGLPWTLALAVQEMWQGANLAWGLCPLLTIGAVEALEAFGTEAQKTRYLPRLVSGDWTATMCLTEPQAGSDLSRLTTRAVPDGAGYRLSGQKIYITYGDHDFTDNVAHLVLARLPDAPEGTKGISLFLVPKVLVNPDGTLGERNDVAVVSLERKLGIHASPTCVMSFGEEGGAWGELIGEPHRGLQAMFTMMNSARLHVGLQGVGVAERAYQQARAHAADRVQGRGADGAPVAIDRHPDVRRQLITMRALTEAMRGLVLETGVAMDLAQSHADAGWRDWARGRVDLMTPVVKGWCTDTAIEVASIGVQVHGGMGYVEETGAAQHYRDARILPIYEGTNGIQAIDLLTRKLLRDEGAAFEQYLEELWSLINRMNGLGGEEVARLRKPFAAAVDALDQASDWLLATGPRDGPAALGGASPFLAMLGLVGGGAVMIRAGLAAIAILEDDQAAAGPAGARARAKLATALYYAEAILPRAQGLMPAVSAGAGLAALPDEAF